MPGSHHHDQEQKIPISPKDSWWPFEVLPSSPLTPNSGPLSLSRDSLAFSEVLYKWNYIVGTLLYVASFLIIIIDIHPCSSVDQLFVSPHGQVLQHFIILDSPRITHFLLISI